MNAFNVYLIVKNNGKMKIIDLKITHLSQMQLYKIL